MSSNSLRGDALGPLTDGFAGAWLTHAFQLLIVTSAFACQLAFFNTAARYLFALGREGWRERSAHVVLEGARP
jgi:hypothetical protein